MEAHGGRIWAESDGPGQGARFTITVPAVQEAGADAGRRSSQSSPHLEQTEREQGRVLVVDDDPQTLRYVREGLTKVSYAPIVTGDPEETLPPIEVNNPHLVLLDLLLAGTDGIDLLTDIQQVTNVPVIFPSVYGQDEVIARAFDLAAVDYVVKPFSPTELSARIRAALRRRAIPEPAEPTEPHVLGQLTLDCVRRALTVAECPVPFTAIEYRLLYELSVNARKTLTYVPLLRRVWGVKDSSDLRPMRTVERNLRRKLGDDANNPAYIFTEPPVGYRMPEPDNSGPATPSR